MIKSAYNFVPLNEEVFTPKWGPYISHDFPFEEGLSGQIVLKLEAKSPIYVRNEGRRKKENNEADQPAESADFIQHEGRYFLPGSSIRGMLRTLVEIMTFGQLDQFNDRRFGYRDFIPDSDYNRNFLKNYSENQGFGWLYWRNHKLVIQDQPDEDIPDEEEEQDLATDELSIVSKLQEKLRAGAEDVELKFAYTKYQKLHPNGRYPFEDLSEKNPLVEVDFDATYCMILVGQKNETDFDNSVYRKRSFDPNKPEYINVGSKVFENFKIAMGDALATENGDWTYWKRFLNQGRPIPVFFRQDEKSDKVNSFGLCKTYRLAYQYGIEEIIRARQARQQHLDFAKCLFGHTEEKGQGSTFLKGRVHIAHAWAEGEPQPMQEVTGILGGPKASFFPYYLEQKVRPNGNVNGAYNTWNTAPGEANIAGRKRYPIHAGSNVQAPGQSGNDDVSTSFCPLGKETTFCTTLNFHNLLPVELGALLSALSFHGQENCYHNIGMGKALGYGKVAVTIDPGNSKIGDQCLDQIQQQSFMGLFEAQMNTGLRRGAWRERPEIMELINMARPANLRTNVRLEYPTLEVTDERRGGNLNEFQTLKNQKQGLPRYSKLLNEPVAVVAVGSLTTKNEPFTNDLISFVLQKLQGQLSRHLNDLNTVIESLKDLEQDAQAKKAKEDETNKQAKIEKARTTIPLNILEAKSFDKLSRLMRTWRNKIKMTDSPIPDDLQQELEEKLQALWEVEKGKPRLLRNWLSLKHGPYKKISAWIGPKKTEAFFKKNNIDPK